MEDSECIELITKLLSKFARTIPDNDPDKEEMIANFRTLLDDVRNCLAEDPKIKASKFLMTVGLKYREKNLRE